MTKRLNSDRYGEVINLRVKQSTKDKIAEVAVNTDQSKGQVMRELFTVGLRVLEIEKEIAEREND